MKVTSHFCCVVLLLVLGAIAQADEVDGLKDAQESEIAALHELDVDAYLATLHPDEVSMFAWEVFPVDYKGKREVRRRAVENFFANSEFLRITSINKGYRAIDTTGLVWGHVKIKMKPKDGPLQIRYF